MTWKPTSVLFAFLVSCLMMLSSPAGAWKHSSDGKSLEIHVDQQRVEFDYDGHVEVTCSVKGGTKISNTPFMSFSWLLSEDSSMPLSSNEFGLSIESAPYEFDTKQVPGVIFQSETLILTPRFYRYLRPGDNLFVCKAYNLDGQRVKEYFIIHKL